MPAPSQRVTARQALPLAEFARDSANQGWGLRSIFSSVTQLIPGMRTPANPPASTQTAITSPSNGPSRQSRALEGSSSNPITPPHRVRGLDSDLYSDPGARRIRPKTRSEAFRERLDNVERREVLRLEQQRQIHKERIGKLRREARRKHREAARKAASHNPAAQSTTVDNALSKTTATQDAAAQKISGQKAAARAKTTQTTATNQPERSRKRVRVPIDSLPVIPSRRKDDCSGTYRMCEEFFEQSSDEENFAEISLFEDEVPWGELLPLPSKKARMSIDKGPEAPLPSTIANAALASSYPSGDVKRATPYVGKHFAVSSDTTNFNGGNVFSQSINFPAAENSNEGVETAKPDAKIAEYVRKHGHSDEHDPNFNWEGHFCVPEGSSSEEEDEVNSPGSAAKTQPVAPLSKEAQAWTQPPPPRPTPAHASLPGTASPNVSQDSALARARSQAEKYKPKQPSGLRASSGFSLQDYLSTKFPVDDEVPGFNYDLPSNEVSDEDAIDFPLASTITWQPMIASVLDDHGMSVDDVGALLDFNDGYDDFCKRNGDGAGVLALQYDGVASVLDDSGRNVDDMGALLDFNRGYDAFRKQNSDAAGVFALQYDGAAI
jgi:hypothetical protein